MSNIDPDILDEINKLRQELADKQAAKDAEITRLVNENNSLRSSRQIQRNSDVPGVNYTVAEDDTRQTVTDDKGNVSYAHPLDTIGAKHGVDRGLVYAYNATVLEGNATARGFTDSDGGRIIFPGTVLRIPVSA